MEIEPDEMDLTKAESKAKVPQAPLEKEKAIEDARCEAMIGAIDENNIEQENK